MKKILARIMIVIPAIILQMVWYFIALGWLNNLFREHLWEILNALFSVLAVIFVTGLVAKRDESSYKLLWVMVIVAMPIFGAMLYVFWGNKNTGKKLKKNLEQSATVLSKPADIVDNECLSDIRKNDLRIGQTLEHIICSQQRPI